MYITEVEMTGAETSAEKLLFDQPKLQILRFSTHVDELPSAEFKLCLDLISWQNQSFAISITNLRFHQGTQ